MQGKRPNVTGSVDPAAKGINGSSGWEPKVSSILIEIRCTFFIVMVSAHLEEVREERMIEEIWPEARVD